MSLIINDFYFFFHKLEDNHKPIFNEEADFYLHSSG